jgi:adenylosuccinate synthase
MRARAVIGANFGDEGKGLVVDYLCATQGAGMVVRFNGGAQAGHTVVTPHGQRHVFHHVGAGTFCNVPTFLSQFFICNPILLMKELDELAALGYRPEIYAHPKCMVTTFADMLINQRREDARGEKRHGSVGVGINETINRTQAGIEITMADLWNGIDVRPRLSEICDKYARFRTGKPIENSEAMIEAFAGGLGKFANVVHPLGIEQCKDPIFEGAQGLLLDQDNKEYFPHLTRSHTGMQNVRMLLRQAGIDRAELYYVSRTYLTRHGAGPLPREDDRMAYRDDTNTVHPFQGRLRFAPLVMEELSARVAHDALADPFSFVFTHCDQRPLGFPPETYDNILTAHGPTFEDISP